VGAKVAPTALAAAVSLDECLVISVGVCCDWQVECLLFPLMRNQRLMLSSISADESLVKEFVQRAMDVFQRNTVGPQNYLNLYRKYAELLNGKSDQDVTGFLAKHHSIDSFAKVSCDFTALLVTVRFSYFSGLTPHAGSGVVRIDPLRFLAGCRTRRLNQV